MAPDQNGTALDFSNSNSLNIEVEFNTDPSWLIENCQVIVAVQDMVTKEFLNGAIANLNEPNASDVLVTFDPVLSEVSTNEIFTKEITIAGVENLGSFEINLNFNSEDLQLNSAELGAFLGSTGRSIFPIANSIDNQNGSLEYAITTIGSTIPGPDGDGVLLILEWTANDDIPEDVFTDIIFESTQITEPNGTVIPVNVEDGQVSISACYEFDFDCDCDVDIVDVTMAAYVYGTSTGDANYDPQYDMDDDGDVDIVDITMLTYNYGWACDDKKSQPAELEPLLEEACILGFSDIRAIDMSKQIFEQNVNLENIADFGGIEFQLSYNNQDCEVLSLIEGDFIRNTKREMLELNRTIDPERAVLSYATTGLGYNQKGESGSGTILTIRYKSKYGQSN